jgi:hypothetical protein
LFYGHPQTRVGAINSLPPVVTLKEKQDMMERFANCFFFPLIDQQIDEITGQPWPSEK